MTQDHNDEIDLGLLFRKIKEGYNNTLAKAYLAIQFVIKYWLVFFILIVVGAVVGHFWQKNQKANKQAVLIVQNNFDSSSYVYNAIELLNNKQKQGDVVFLSKYGFNPNVPEIADIIIEPIVNIMELIGKSEANDRNLEQYLAQSDFEDDILLSEVYYTEYKFHKIFITTTSEGNEATIGKILSYLNSNETFLKAKELVISETKMRIKRNDISIENIDALFVENAGKSNNSAGNASQIFFKSQANNNLHLLIEAKNDLIAENQEIKIDLLKYNNIVTVINKPSLLYVFSFSDNKRTLLPLALIFLFSFFFVLRGMYLKGKAISQEKNKA